MKLEEFMKGCSIKLAKEKCEKIFKEFSERRENIDKHFVGCVASGEIFSVPCQEFRLDMANEPDLEKMMKVWE